MAKTDLERRVLALFQAMLVIESTTTSAGNAGGMSIIDSTLIGAGANSYLTCAVIINPGDYTSFDVKPVAGFNNATGEVTVSSAFKGGQVATDVRYMIVSLGGGGTPPPPVAPSIGLWMFGVCDPGMTASTTTLLCSNLAGFPDDIFNGEFWVQVIHNANAAGAAPEGEWRKISDYVGATGTFTVDAFSANVEENDLLAIVHESIVGIEIVGTGTLTTSSATVPADNTRGEANDYFNGCLLMTTEGAVRFQPRLIADFTVTTGVFTLDAEHPFTAAPGLVDYVIIRFQGALVPAADGANNLTLMDVVGNKTDTADYTAGATTSSLMRLLKGVLGSRVIAEGTLTTSSATVPADNGRGEANDYFNGCYLMTVAGARAFQPRLIVDFTVTTGVFTLDPEHPFTGVPGTVAYVILAAQGSLIPATDGVNDRTVMDVVGAKADTPDYTRAATTSSLQRLVKGILGSRVIAEGTFDTSSATVPADSSRGEGNDFFNGSLLIPLTGAVAFQPRLIVDFTITTGVFTIDSEHPFTAATGTVAYIVVAFDGDLVPAADSTADQTTGHVVGKKSDAAAAGVIGITKSLIALLKQAVTQQGGYYFGDVSTHTDANTFASTDLAGRENDYFVGWYVFCVRDDGGASAAPQGESKLITDYVSSTGTFTHDAFSANMAVGDQVMIVHPLLYDRLVNIDDKVSGMLVQVPFFVEMDTISNDVITLFEFDALGATIREVFVSFYLPLHATATFTPTWEKTRAGDLVTFTQEVDPALAVIALPAANAVYSYKLGEIAQGLQGRFRLAQDNIAGVRTIDAFAVVLMEV